MAPVLANREQRDHWADGRVQEVEEHPDGAHQRAVRRCQRPRPAHQQADQCRCSAQHRRQQSLYYVLLLYSVREECSRKNNVNRQSQSLWPKIFKNFVIEILAFQF